MDLTDCWIERFVKDQKGLEDAQGSWIAINRKLLELAWNGAFMYGPDPSGAITRTGTGCIAIDEWALDTKNGNIGIRYVYDFVRDNHGDRRCISEAWYTCPIDWLFMPEAQYVPLIEGRIKTLRARRSAAAKIAEREERRSRYLQLQQELEELRAEIEAEEQSDDSSEG